MWKTKYQVRHIEKKITVTGVLVALFVKTINALTADV